MILPTYNSNEYLHSSVSSILNQTFKSFELLIIDDGSTDNTEELVKNYDDSRILYYKITHTGLANSLNFGLKKASYTEQFGLLEWMQMI